MDWTTFWVFLHVLGAIVGFGPTFTFPLIGAMAGKEPMHGNFAIRISHLISTRLVIPVAVLQAATGTILIFVADWNLPDNPWLLISIVLFAISLSFSLFVQGRWQSRLIELTREPPPPGAQGQGPPPDAAALVRNLRVGGAFLTVLLVTIIVLMVYKPGAG